MNSLFDLCEYGLKVRECQKLRLASITPKNIILSDIKINNDLKVSKAFYKARKIYMKHPKVFKVNSIYELIEYGISEDIASKIHLKGLDISKIIELSDEDLYSKYNIKKATCLKIRKALEKFNHEISLNCNNSNFESYINAISKLRQFGLTTSTYNKILKAEILFDNLIYMSVEDIMEKLSVTKPTAYNITLVCNKYKLANELSKYRPIDELESYIHKTTLRKYISFKEINDYWNKKKFKEDLSKILSILKENDKIIKKNNMYRYNFIHIKEIVNLNKKEKVRKILLERLKGKSLQSIGNDFNLTKERVRQIYNKEIKKVDVYEEIYFDFFTNYCFNEQDFCTIFQEDYMTYNYLDSLYKKGEKTVLEFLNDFPERINPEIENEILNRYNLIDLDGEKIKLNYFDIIINFVKTLESQTKVEKILRELNKIFEQNNLKKITLRLLEARLNRNKTYNVISTIGKKYRFYDYEKLKDNDIQKIILIFDKYQDGVYSTYKPFIDNIEFFKDINIRDEYELHSLIRVLELNDIILDRMPIFTIGNISKYDFFLEKISEKSPIPLDDFLDYMYKKFGHKINTTKSYLQLEFKDFINFNYINVNLNKLNQDQIVLIKQKLEDDIYSIKDFCKLINHTLNGNYNKFLNNYNLRNLGYKLNMNYIVKLDINSLEQYWTNSIMKRDIYQKEDKYNTSTYEIVLKKLEKQNKIIRITEDKYITQTKLNQLGITEDVINEYKKILDKKVSIEQYFTIHFIHKECRFEPIDKYGFDDTFYESILYSQDNFAYVKMDGVIVFKKIKAGEKNRISKNEFIKTLIKNSKPIDIYEFVDYLKKEYDIISSKEEIQQICVETGVYYDKIMQKIFYSKEDYYKEVYGNV